MSFYSLLLVCFAFNALNCRTGDKNLSRLQKSKTCANNTINQLIQVHVKMTTRMVYMYISDLAQEFSISPTTVKRKL